MQGRLCRFYSVYQCQMQTREENISYLLWDKFYCLFVVVYLASLKKKHTTKTRSNFSHLKMDSPPHNARPVAHAFLRVEE